MFQFLVLICLLVMVVFLLERFSFSEYTCVTGCVKVYIVVFRHDEATLKEGDHLNEFTMSGERHKALHC